MKSQCFGRLCCFSLWRSSSKRFYSSLHVCQLSNTELCSSGDIPQPPATPSYLYRLNINNWFHELLLHVSSETEWPDRREKLPQLTFKRVGEHEIKNKEDRRVKGEGRAQKLLDEVFSIAWQWFVHRLGRNQDGALLKKTKKLPGWAGVFAERDTDGETNEFSHSRVGNLLCEDTEGFRALLLMRRSADWRIINVTWGEGM